MRKRAGIELGMDAQNSISRRGDDWNANILFAKKRAKLDHFCANFQARAAKMDTIISDISAASHPSIMKKKALMIKLFQV